MEPLAIAVVLVCSLALALTGAGVMLLGVLRLMARFRVEGAALIGDAAAPPAVSSVSR